MRVIFVRVALIMFVVVWGSIVIAGNSLQSIKMTRKSIFLYGKVPWDLDKIEMKSTRKGVFLYLKDTENVSSVSDIEVTPIPYLERVVVRYDRIGNCTKLFFDIPEDFNVKLKTFGKILSIKFLPKSSKSEGVFLGQSKKISLSFKNTDIRDVIKAISEAFDVNFVVDPDVAGSVTVELRDVPLDKAMKVILDSNDLTMVQEGNNIYRVMTKKKFLSQYKFNKRLSQAIYDFNRQFVDSKKKDLKSLKDVLENFEDLARTLGVLEKVYPRIFELKYINAVEVAGIVEALITSPCGETKSSGLLEARFESNSVGGEAKTAKEEVKEAKSEVYKGNCLAIFPPLVKQVVPIKRLNALLVIATSDDFERIEDFLKKVDVAVPQIQIKAKIVEISTGRFKELGLKWQTTFNQQETEYNFPHALESNFAVDLGFISPFVEALNPAGTLALRLLSRHQTFAIDVKLSALERHGYAKVVSSPRLLTMNHKEAKIVQGYEIPYSTTSDQGTEVEFKEASLRLNVIPHLTSAGDIVLNIEVSKDSPDFDKMTPYGVPIRKRSIVTNVRMKDGETLVIGGIYEMNEVKEYAGIPVLNRIPLLHWLFERRYRNVDKRELLIFITPEVIRKGEIAKGEL